MIQTRLKATFLIQKNTWDAYLWFSINKNLVGLGEVDLTWQEGGVEADGGGVDHEGTQHSVCWIFPHSGNHLMTIILTAAKTGSNMKDWPYDEAGARSAPKSENGEIILF